MDSFSSPLKRKSEARRTKRKKRTAATRWTNRRKRREKCCREVRNAIKPTPKCPVWENLWISSPPLLIPFASLSPRRPCLKYFFPNLFISYILKLKKDLTRLCRWEKIHRHSSWNISISCLYILNTWDLIDKHCLLPKRELERCMSKNWNLYIENLAEKYAHIWNHSRRRSYIYVYDIILVAVCHWRHWRQSIEMKPNALMILITQSMSLSQITAF